jgi:sporulation integral membrane protein YlbJ
MVNKYTTNPVKIQTIKLFKSNNLSVFISFFIIILLLGLALDPKTYIESTLNGLVVFCTVVLPALLPFFVLTKMLTTLQVINSFCNFLHPITKFLFKAPAISSYIFLMSIISGYPVGAKLIAECYEEGLITNKEAEKISTFTSNSGPMFIVGTVGVGFLLSYTAGVIVLVSHILGSVLNGIFYRGAFTTKQLNNNSKIPKKQVDLDKLFENSVYSSVLSLLTIGAYIAIFFTLVELLNNWHFFEAVVKILSPILNLLKLNSNFILAAFEGLVEITKGTYSVAQLGENLRISTISCSFLISFGGASVYFQSLSFLNTCKINKKFYLLQKLTHAVFSAFICYFLVAVLKLL